MNKNLFSAQSPILVALSGGADSLCLLGTLHEQGYPLLVAHFDHQLRPDSADDAEFARQIAEKYGHPFVSGRGDVAAYAKEQKESIEEAARNLRYRFLFQQARKHNAQAVAVGHTADDQVETILMHFLRGAGLSGLKGMESRVLLPAFDSQIPLVRPILNLWRADTEAYCRAHHLTPREDPSNASLVYFRNKLRHKLIPELEKYNPRFRATLFRSAQTLQGDYALIRELTAQKYAEICRAENENYLSFQLSPFSKLSIPLMRNLIKFSMEKLLRGQADISFSTLDRAAKFIASSQAAQRLELGSGLLLFREADFLYLTDDEANLPRDSFPQMDAETLPLAFPCEIDLGWGWVLSGEISDAAPAPFNGDPFQVALDADALGENLTLRPRRAGDRFAPLGMEGQSMKLKDFLINVKLPRRIRERYPLLCADDEIIWIPGYRPAHRVRVTDTTARVAQMRLRRLA